MDSDNSINEESKSITYAIIEFDKHCQNRRTLFSAFEQTQKIRFKFK